MPTQKQLNYWQSLKGKKQSSEVVEKRRLKLIGHITSEETKRKIALTNSITQRGKPKPWLLGKKTNTRTKR